MKTKSKVASLEGMLSELNGHYHIPANSPTIAEQQYDSAFTAYQEYDSRDNAEILALAEHYLRKERRLIERSQRAMEAKIIKELNRSQGRTLQRRTADEKLMHWILLAFSGLMLGWWAWNFIRTLLGK